MGPDLISAQPTNRGPAHRPRGLHGPVHELPHAHEAVLESARPPARGWAELHPPQHAPGAAALLLTLLRGPSALRQPLHQERGSTGVTK